MRRDIDVVGLAPSRLENIAGLVEELGQRCVGKVVGKGAGMRNGNVDLDRPVEAGLEPVGVVS